MKIAATYSLAFHRWILADTVTALRAANHRVIEVEHHPQHAHDWLCGPGGAAALDQLAAAKPDVVLAAEYPYAPLRAAARAPVVATRHSLAGRRNTWEPDQADADWLVTFGAWDEALLAERGIRPRRGTLAAGCPWAGPLLSGDRKQARADLCARLALDPYRPIVAWAPTWNADLSPRAFVSSWAREATPYQVVARPHFATRWRYPEQSRYPWLVEDDPLAHPAGLLLGADLLVGDVSGILLLGLAVPDAALPIVQVEPDPGAARRSAQYDPGAPEWTYRDEIGPRVADADALDTAVRGLLNGDAWQKRRRGIAKTLFGRAQGGPLPAARLVQLLEAAWRK